MNIVSFEGFRLHPLLCEDHHEDDCVCVCVRARVCVE